MTSLAAGPKPGFDHLLERATKDCLPNGELRSLRNDFYLLLHCLRGRGRELGGEGLPKDLRIKLIPLSSSPRGGFLRF